MKFINLDKYIIAFPNYAQRYNNASDVEKREIMREFVTFLSSNRYDSIIDFEIEKQLFTSNRRRATVFAVVQRQATLRPMAYTYKYELEKHNNYWRIVDVEATVTRSRR